MKMATGDAVLKAYDRAVKNIDRDEDMSSCAVSAGFIFPGGQPRGKREGYQVFVKVCRFSEELLKREPETGGMLLKP